MLQAKSVADERELQLAARELLGDDFIVDYLRVTLDTHAEGELGPLAVGRLDLDVAIVLVGDSFANVETKADALLILLAGAA